MTRLALPASLALIVSLAACQKNSPTDTATDSGTGGQCVAPTAVKDSSGTCVECLKSSDCPASTYCNLSGAAPTCASCSGAPAGSCGSPDAGHADAGMDAGNSDAGPCAGMCGPLGETCCGDTCTDTMSDPSANCGGCGMPACPAATSGMGACCMGACSDLSSDPMNCGACGTACNGSIKCINGMCQNGFAVLTVFDVTGSISVSGVDAGTITPTDGGTPSAPQVEVLKPSVVLSPGQLSGTTLMNFQSNPCNAAHYNATTPLPAALNAGNITIKGYTGGMLLPPVSAAAPSSIGCSLGMGTNDVYECGYGPLSAMNMPGAAPGEEPYAAGTNAVGTGMIEFSAPGGPTFGSFDIMAAPETPSGCTVGDLSQVTYSTSGDTVIPITCPSSVPYGGYFAIVQATTNPAAHYDEPAVSGGIITCLGAFGTAPLIGSLGPQSVTLTQADITTMIGTDATAPTTFATTIVTLNGNELIALVQSVRNNMDSMGHMIIATAATGQFGINAQK